MQGFSHILNIGTLATWLSVAGLGSVAVFAPERALPPVIVEPPETRLFEEDFTLGEPTPVDTAPSESTAPELPVTPETPAAPPELPVLTEAAPLPEIPEIPVPAPAPTAAPRAATPVTSARRNPEARPRPATGKPAASGASNSAASGGGGGMTQSSRLAAGRMPSPSYPAEAKRKNQTGTVLIEFTVDAEGRVISAYAKSSSGWPLLDSEAVRTVRRWKFPAGPVMKLQRPIVFQLR